jgi:hypothetical protein
LQQYIEKEAEMNSNLLPVRMKIRPSDFFPVECHPGCQTVHRKTLGKSKGSMLVDGVIRKATCWSVLKIFSCT